MLHIEIYHDIFKYVNDDKTIFSLRLVCREFSKFKFRLSNFYVMKKDYRRVSRVFCFNKIILNDYIFRDDNITHIRVNCPCDSDILTHLKRNITYLYVQYLIQSNLSFCEFRNLKFLKVRSTAFRPIKVLNGIEHISLKNAYFHSDCGEVLSNIKYLSIKGFMTLTFSKSFEKSSLEVLKINTSELKNVELDLPLCLKFLMISVRYNTMFKCDNKDLIIDYYIKTN